MLIFGSWPFFNLAALFALRRKDLTGTNQVLWAFLIVAIPVLSALAFIFVKPVESKQL
jgi:hypothetical protein